MKKIFSSIILLIVIASCSTNGRYGGQPSADGNACADTLTSRAGLLTLVDLGEYTIADISDPWNSGRLLHRYILIGRDSPEPRDIPEGTIVKVPLRSSIVYSSVHSGAVKELGSLDAITGVADGMYFNDTDIRRRIESGKITDIGNSSSPAIERIIDLEPEAILLSPYQNSGYGAVETTGVPIIECADYMESTPLARAEWILFIGELYGKRAEAEKIYNGVVRNYTSLSDSVRSASGKRPRVITEMETSGVWYVPGGKSYMASMLADAGAEYPWAGNEDPGSLQLDYAAVFDKASDADIWLVRTFGYDISRKAMLDNNRLNARFKAFRTGEIYGCNTAEKTLYDDLPFHPERILRDFIIILHPEILPGEKTEYYKKM